VTQNLLFNIKDFECKIFTADEGYFYDDRFSLMIKKGSSWDQEPTWFTIPAIELESRNDFWNSRELLIGKKLDL